MNRKELTDNLHSVINVNGHILAVATGSGMTAQYSMEGNADLLIGISAGKFRQMGQSAFSAFFGYTDANKMVLDFSENELLPISNGFPIIGGVFMEDPNINLYDHIKEMKAMGFSGIINYPCIPLITGRFRNALEAADLGFEREVEGIKIAHFLDLFTLAYVTTEEEAIEMVKVGADVICLHFGITGGGKLGANRIISLETAIDRADRIFKVVDKMNPSTIKLISGGPVQTPIDAYSFYEQTPCQGILAGSAVERIPVERSMLNTIKAFKSPGDFSRKNIVSRVLNGHDENIDYGKFLLEYVEKNYSNPIRLKDLAIVTHSSVSKLSLSFKKKTGQSFTNYLIRYRMDKAQELLRDTDYPIKSISSMVGYPDYSQFAKMFHKVNHSTPQEYRDKL